MCHLDGGRCMVGEGPAPFLLARICRPLRERYVPEYSMEIGAYFLTSCTGPMTCYRLSAR